MPFSFIPRSINGDIGAYRSGNVVYINLLSAFTSAIAAQIAMDFIREATEEDVIAITVMSPGGDSVVLNQLGALLDNTKATVKLYVAGIAASCGGFILAHADELYVEPTAIIMFHNATICAVGVHTTRAATYLKCMEAVVAAYTERLVELNLMKPEELSIIKDRNIDVVLCGQDLIDRGVAKPIEGAL